MVRSRLNSNNDLQWQDRDCDAGTCTYSRGCNDEKVDEWYTEMIDKNSKYRISCAENKCHAFCIDPTTQRPNGQVLYKSDKEYKDDKPSMAQKDWDGVITCVNSRDDCGTRSYGLYSLSDFGDLERFWCRPSGYNAKGTHPKFECYDMACDGFRNWIQAGSKPFTPPEMSWRCAEGTCYPECPGDQKATIKIGNNKFDMPSLNCHQNPFFLKAITSGNAYGAVKFFCEADHSKPPVRNGQWHVWGPCVGDCGQNKGTQSRHRDCRGDTGNINCSKGPGSEPNREQRKCTRTNCGHKCSGTSGVTAIESNFCNTGTNDPAGTKEKKKCKDQGTDNPSKREMVCTNPNECRWRCVDRPNDPWYDEYMWHKFPEDVHIQHQPYYTGDMVCKKKGNSWEWKSFWGDNTGHDIGK